MLTKCWSENFKGRDHSEELSVAGRIASEWILGKQCGKVWTGFICIRTGSSDGML
jgi:hypothetical protein